MKVDHRLVAIDGSRSGGDPVKIIQSGYTEPLLCRACEGLLNTWYEQPAKEFWFAMSGEPSPCGITLDLVLDAPPTYLVQGFDYASVKLFLLSLLWRAGVSALPAFSQVNLGPHEAVLRRMLLDKNPGGEREYPCIVLMLTENSQTIFCPVAQREEQHRVYRFLICKLLLLYVVSNHADSLSYSRFSPRTNGSLIAQVRHFKTLPEVEHAASWIRNTSFPEHRLDLLLHRNRRP
ncbi:MAG TPA: hypothetical protein VN999_17940 [Thermoanaerobaculia bacterium]|nr:hypothetical protein [Thermoanaerobaculia bacterium]